MAIPSFFSLFQAHASILQNNYFLPRLHFEIGDVFFSPFISDPAWNFLFIKNAKNSFTEITKIKKSFEEKTRSFVIYASENVFTDDLKSKLNLHQCAFQDVWFWSSLEEIKEAPESPCLKICKTDEDQEIFLKVFSQSYSGTNEKEAYGAVDASYLECWKLAFHTPQQISLYVIYQDEKAVGCLALGKCNDLVGLYGLGIIPSARGNWLWKKASFEAMAIAKQAGASGVFTITERGSTNEKLYRRCGMTEVEIAQGWTF